MQEEVSGLSGCDHLHFHLPKKHVGDQTVAVDGQPHSKHYSLHRTDDVARKQTEKDEVRMHQALVGSLDGGELDFGPWRMG